MPVSVACCWSRPRPGSVTLPGRHLVDLNQIQNKVGKPSSYALAQEIADHAVTLVRDENHILPIARDEHEGVLVLIFVSDAHGDEGRALEHEIRLRIPDARIIYVDRRSASVEAEGISALLPGARKIIAAVYSVSQLRQPRRSRNHQCERPCSTGLGLPGFFGTS